MALGTQILGLFESYYPLHLHIEFTDSDLSGSQTPFLLKFFPDVYAKQQATADSYSGSVYCKFEDAKLQLFTSSLFLAGASNDTHNLHPPYVVSR